MFKYFISYYYEDEDGKTGFSNAQIGLNDVLDNVRQLEAAQAKLKALDKKKKVVVITNYVLMKEEG